MTTHTQCPFYNFPDWVDFVRGLCTIPHFEMQAHLSSGCLSCERMLRVYAKVVAAARRDCQYVLPATMVERARRIFVDAQMRAATRERHEGNAA